MDVFLMIKKVFHIYSSKMYTPLNKIESSSIWKELPIQGIDIYIPSL